MTALPIFERFAVRDYGLYPGDSSKRGLDLTFQPGMTLVLGANGLGKTTLVTMLYRMCTGPYEIPGLTSSSELGTRNLKHKKLPRSDTHIFADRVVDGAQAATATLQMRLGDARIRVTRALASLDITELDIDGEQPAATEQAFQKAVSTHAGLSTFGDWILLLQHLTFYFETRRALVWDPSAQRQILRILFLAQNRSDEWKRLEREIVEGDSHMRNLQAALTREERELAALARLGGDGGVLKDELSLLEKLQTVDEKKRVDLSERLLSEDAARQAARLDMLKAEDEHESAYRDLERQQLSIIAAAFPNEDDTARYLLGRLFSEEVCLACGHSAPRTVAALRKRQSNSHCVVCDTAIAPMPKASTAAARSLSRASATLQAAAERLATTDAERQAAEAACEAISRQLQELNASSAERTARINKIISQLPPQEVDMHAKRDELATLRASVERMKARLAEQRKTFSAFMDRVNRGIAKSKQDVQESFAQFAEGFLLEDCKLTWSPHKVKLGGYGELIPFPAFELEMGGSDFPSPVRRHGPQQVSESQREFIDLAFRMALTATATAEGAGTLVIDAPESSLDAVFVSRAAEVLTRFARPDSHNRLVVTSNLVEGDLIPQLIRRARIPSASDARIVDLLKLAAPTIATREHHSDYVKVRRELFKRAKQLKA